MHTDVGNHVIKTWSIWVLDQWPCVSYLYHRAVLDITWCGCTAEWRNNLVVITQFSKRYFVIIFVIIHKLSSFKYMHALSFSECLLDGSKASLMIEVNSRPPLDGFLSRCTYRKACRIWDPGSSRHVSLQHTKSTRMYSAVFVRTALNRNTQRSHCSKFREGEMKITEDNAEVQTLQEALMHENSQQAWKSEAYCVIIGQTDHRVVGRRGVATVGPIRQYISIII